MSVRHGRGRGASGSCPSRPLPTLAALLVLLVQKSVEKDPSSARIHHPGQQKHSQSSVKHYNLYTRMEEEITNPVTYRGCVYPCKCRPTLGAPWGKLSKRWYLVAENPKEFPVPRDTKCQGVDVDSSSRTSFLQTDAAELKFPSEIKYVNNTIWQLVKHPRSKEERHSGLYQFVTLVDDKTLLIYQCGPAIQKQRMDHLQIFSSTKGKFPLERAIELSNEYSTQHIPYVRYYDNSACTV